MNDSEELLTQHIEWKTAGILLMLFVLVIYLPGILGSVPYPSSKAQFSDILLAHYPYLRTINRSLIDFHQVPLWSNLIYSGTPLYANPLAGMFYPPGWLAVVFPRISVINLLAGLHTVWGGLGLFLAMKDRGLSSLSALFAGAAFALLPKLSAQYGAGHLTLIYAVSWTPWLLYAAGKRRKILLSGVIMAVIFLADPRWIIFSGILLLVEFLNRFQNTGNALWSFLRTGLLALLLASPLWLGMMQYIRHSTRASMTAADRSVFSLPPEGLLGLIFPTWNGNPEWVGYLGAAGIFGILIAIFDNRLRKNTGRWIVLLGAGILVSLGNYLPGWEALSGLPFFSLLRVPPRSLLLSGFSAAVIIGYVSDALVRNEIGKKLISQIGAGFIAAGLSFGIGILIMAGKDAPLPILYGSGMLLLAGLIPAAAGVCKQNEIQAYLLIGLLIADFLVFGRLVIDWRKGSPGEESQIAQLLSETSQNYYRVYSPSYSLTQSEAADYNLELTYGIDPLQLKTYADYFQEASGVTLHGYSVSLPPFRSGSILQDNQGYTPDANLLGTLNVRYLLSSFPVQAEGFKLVNVIDETFVYENRRDMSRAWVENSGGNVVSDLEKSSGVEIVSWSPNKLVFQAEGPGRLILSEVNYPGWVVEVDGQKQEVETSYQILRSVKLGEGEHRVIFSFHPLEIYLGGVGFLLGFGILVWFWRKQKNC